MSPLSTYLTNAKPFRLESNRYRCPMLCEWKHAALSRSGNYATVRLPFTTQESRTHTTSINMYNTNILKWYRLYWLITAQHVRYLTPCPVERPDKAAMYATVCNPTDCKRDLDDLALIVHCVRRNCRPFSFLAFVPFSFATW